MPSHATWADSLGWSHSPMREEAGLSYPAIESFAERPAMGERKKKCCDRVIGVQKILLYLPTFSSAQHTTPALRQKAHTSQLPKIKPTQLWVSLHAANKHLLISFAVVERVMLFHFHCFVPLCRYTASYVTVASTDALDKLRQRCRCVNRMPLHDLFSYLLFSSNQRIF